MPHFSKSCIPLVYEQFSCKKIMQLVYLYALCLDSLANKATSSTTNYTSEEFLSIVCSYPYRKSPSKDDKCSRKDLSELVFCATQQKVQLEANWCVSSDKAGRAYVLCSTVHNHVPGERQSTSRISTLYCQRNHAAIHGGRSEREGLKGPSLNFCRLPAKKIFSFHVSDTSASAYDSRSPALPFTSSNLFTPHG